ncbi:type I restriction endonuclease subunit R [Mycoplasma sp. VS276A1]
MAFNEESKFEEALIKQLKNRSWGEVLNRPNEEQLIDNWAKIIFNNNREKNRLGDYPLTKGEKDQLLDKIRELKSPYELNEFITGITTSIKRDNKDDIENYGKEVSLFIFDAKEISGGKSVYQIAQQPMLKNNHRNNRGDLMLLINGLPLVHIELKKTGVPINDAINQIKLYYTEGSFSHNFFSLIQIFVAMNPEEMVYFANPGSAENFKPEYRFHWADEKHNQIDDWQDVASSFLSIPRLHELVGRYSVADATDHTLKILRSYQYHAVNKIYDTVFEIDNKKYWGTNAAKGGYIWHTTGSGKTMTSFKAAKLIADSGYADRVVFLVDRIELANQSYEQYSNFTFDDDIVGTSSTYDLIKKLTKGEKPLIITSIQKMNKLATDENIKDSDLSLIDKQRIVFIVDECHRSTFGDMFNNIKKLFNKSVFFGFTGTPIFEENSKKENTTTDVFGNELHRYSIYEGLKDKNVLPFDTYAIKIFNDREMRTKVALKQANYKSIEEASQDADSKSDNSQVYDYWMFKAPMLGYTTPTGERVKGIEDCIPNSQYRKEEYQNKVVDAILNDFYITSVERTYHGIFATSSIPEAITYYRKFKQAIANTSDPNKKLKITILFDPSIDNAGDTDKNFEKELAKEEIIADYNKMFDKTIDVQDWADFKKDVAIRLAHKFKPLIKEGKTNKDYYLDLLIVVDQMLTGYDSKFVNTLYLDKVLDYENLVQAFSRTNRIHDAKKTHGVIKYFRRPHLMAKNIEIAFDNYSGNRREGIFVDKLPDNMNSINDIYKQISNLFFANDIKDFAKVPESTPQANKFASLFAQLNRKIQSAKVQGYEFKDYEHDGKITRNLLDYKTYLILERRYCDLQDTAQKSLISVGQSNYELTTYINEQNSLKIDVDYIQDNFNKLIQSYSSNNPDLEERKKLIDALQNSFVLLNQQEQKYAIHLLHGLDSGSIVIQKDKSFRDYLNEFLISDKDKAIMDFCNNFGITQIDKFKDLLEEASSLNNFNEYGIKDDIDKLIDQDKAWEYIQMKYPNSGSRNFSRNRDEEVNNFIKHNK